MNGSVRCVTREERKMWGVFYCTVMVCRGEKGDGKHDE